MFLVKEPLDKGVVWIHVIHSRPSWKGEHSFARKARIFPTVMGYHPIIENGSAKMIDQEPEAFSRSLDCVASLTSDEVAELQNVLVVVEHCLEHGFLLHWHIST